MGLKYEPSSEPLHISAKKLTPKLEQTVSAPTTAPPRTLPWAFASGRRGVLGGWAFSCGCGTPVRARLCLLGAAYTILTPNLEQTVSALKTAAECKLSLPSLSV